MLGKSVRGAILICVCLVFTACAHKVSQDKATGEDGKSKGAKELEFENGEVRASGIVTYPGGDRADWKQIEIPEKKRGKLEIKLAWTPPRPGLQLGFDVFDEWYHPIGGSKRRGRRSKGRVHRKTIPDVRGKGVSAGEGKYFIRVFAVGRGDAGKYKLTVEFKEEMSGPIFDPLKLEVPDPPKLAAVPEPEVPCDPFDAKNPTCANVCPEVGAPPNWPACKGKCIGEPDVENPACQRTMPCPKPPDRRVARCKLTDFPKCPDIANPDPDNPRCDNAKADPVRGRVLSNSVQGSDVIITIGAGSNQGVKKDWKGQMLRGDSDAPLVGGEVTVIRVDKTRTVGKVRMTTDQISANPYVKLSPP